MSKYADYVMTRAQAEADREKRTAEAMREIEAEKKEAEEIVNILTGEENG